MLLLRSSRSSNVCALLASALTRGARGRILCRCHSNVGVQPPGTMVVETEVAEKLEQVGLWIRPASEIPDRAMRPPKPKKRPKGDHRRVNLVSDKLCDDIFAYYGHTLRDRHRGCDILDLFPGAGVWSRKLNDLLEPRSHILMEPDAHLYEPFLGPLLARDGTTLLSTSGADWKHLLEVLSPKYLPHQVERPLSATEDPQRNDTLLITANFTWHPKRKFRAFNSVAQLLIYQFVDSIRSSGLAQKYGLVRMLFWIDDDEKQNIVPRSVQLRRRQAVDSELVTEWVTEVAGLDAHDTFYARDENIDLDSAQATLDRMHAAGVVTPPGRETALLKTVSAPGYQRVTAGEHPPAIEIRGTSELAELLEAERQGHIVPASKDRIRLTKLKSRALSLVKIQEKIKARLDEEASITAALVAAEAANSPTLLAAARLRAEQWNATLSAEPEAFLRPWRPAHDNLHVYRQDPPVLNWDRRPVEPLAVRRADFFPNVPCALIDIQPKAVDKYIRRLPASSSNSHLSKSNIFDLMVRQLVAHSASPAAEVLEQLHPGAGLDVMQAWASYRDPARGGSPVGGHWGQLSARCLNARQLEELINVWAQSPFAPGFADLLRYTDDLTDLDSGEGMAMNPAGRVGAKGAL